MKVGWLIDGEMFPNYCDELVAAISAEGHSAHVLQSPRPPYRWDDLRRTYRDAFRAGDCVIAHGDIELISRIGTERLWTPGVFATIDHFFCSSYFPHYGEYLLNNDYVMLPFGELARQRDFLLETLGIDDTVFIRPDSPLKLFTGQVAKRESFAADIEYMGFYEFPANSIVVVSSPKSIVYEWRFVVVRGQVVAGCQYAANGVHDESPCYPHEALALAETIAANEYQPDPVWILDICQTVEGDYRLLEIGGFSFANLYACPKSEVVRSVSDTASHLWELQQEVEQ